MLTKREKATKDRFNNSQRALNVLDELFEKGFTRDLPVFVAIVQGYYPDLTYSVINNFWHLRTVSDDVLTKMENVLEQLKGE